MSDAAKLTIPGVGDNLKSPQYNQAGDSWILVQMATQADLTAHLNDTDDAHDASAISFAAATGFVATNAQAAIEEARSDAQGFVTTHEAAGDPHPQYLTTTEANALYHALSTDLATQVELDAHINDTTAAHAASAIAFTPVGSIASTDVAAALAEIATEYAAADSAHVAAGDPHTQYHTDARGDARYWQLTTDLATQAELNAHESDTTSVHGIADTANLVLRTTSNALTGSRIEIGNGTKALELWADATAARITSKDATEIIVGHALEVAANFNVTGTLSVGDVALAEIIRDTIGSALVAGTDVSISVNDGADTITINAVGVPNIAYGTTAPSSPATGDYWLDTN